MQVGDSIGIILKCLRNGEAYWKLAEGKIKSITFNSKGRRVKADHFYTLDADEVEENTQWLMESPALILVSEPFLLNDDLRKRVETWIEENNRRAKNAEYKKQLIEGTDIESCPEEMAGGERG